MLYDKNSLVAAVTSDSHLNFFVGQTWSFRAPVFNQEAVRASTPIFSCEHGKLPHRDDFQCDFIVSTDSFAAKPISVTPQPQG
jgi:hypothetical protein